MARDKGTLVNIDKSDSTNYPNGRVKDNTGSGDGTPVDEFVYGDIHEFFAKIMRLAGIQYNGLPDNEQLGYQLVNALVAVPTKNDYIYSLSASGRIFSVSFKIGTLKNDESIILKSLLNVTSQNQIKGSDNITKAVTIVGGAIKENEYIRLVNTSTSVVLIRLIDSSNLENVNTELKFLKAATQEEEDGGSISSKATTPLTNKTTFAKRINGNPSIDYLASEERNGLLSKELWKVINNLGQSAIKNIGFFSGFDGGGSRGDLAFGGDILRAVAIVGNGSQVTCTMANAMDDTNYLVKHYVESQGDPGADNDIYQASFRILNRTQFIFNIDELAGQVQNLKIHFEIQQL